MKNKIVVVISFLLGGLLFGTIGVYAATTLASSAVSYSNTTSGGSYTNVQGAIDELYNLSKNKSTVTNSKNVYYDYQQVKGTKSYTFTAAENGYYVINTSNSTHPSSANLNDTSWGGPCSTSQFTTTGTLIKKNNDVSTNWYILTGALYYLEKNQTITVSLTSSNPYSIKFVIVNKVDIYNSTSGSSSVNNLKNVYYNYQQAKGTNTYTFTATEDGYYLIDTSNGIHPSAANLGDTSWGGPCLTSGFSTTGTLIKNVNDVKTNWYNLTSSLFYLETGQTISVSMTSSNPYSIKFVTVNKIEV